MAFKGSSFFLELFTRGNIYRINDMTSGICFNMKRGKVGGEFVGHELLSVEVGCESCEFIRLVYFACV